MWQSGRHCPHATDPKTLTSFAPRRRTVRRMDSGFSRSFAILGVHPPRRPGEPSANRSSRTPMTASNRSQGATDGDDAPDSYRETAGWDVPARAASAPGPDRCPAVAFGSPSPHP